MSPSPLLRRQSDQSAVLTIDDRNSDIHYASGQWYEANTGNPAIHGGTLSQLASAGGGFFFSFNGSQIKVFGVVTLPVRGGTSNYSPTSSIYAIDGTQAGTYIAPNVTQEEDQVVFFDSGPLSGTSHSLTVIVQDVTADCPYIFDYLVVTPAEISSSETPPAPPVSSPSSISPSSSSPSLSSSIPSSSATPPPTDTPASSSSSMTVIPPSFSSSSTIAASSFSPSATMVVPPSASSPAIQLPSGSASPTTSTYTVIAPKSVSPAGALSSTVSCAKRSSCVAPIAGGVVGGIALFVVLVSLLLCYLRRRRAASQGEASETEYRAMRISNGLDGASGTQGVTPYLLPRDYRASSASFVPRESIAPLVPGSVQGNLGSQDGSKEDGYGSGYEASPPPGAARPQPPMAMAGPPSAVSLLPRPRGMHADSGIRFPRDANPDEVLSEATTLPPAYTHD